MTSKFDMTLYGISPSAGVGNELLEDMPRMHILVSDTPKNRKADFLLKVDGNSMQPLYNDSDIVLVKSQDAVDIDDVGIFAIDGKVVIKKFKGDYLYSVNREYDDIHPSDDAYIKCFGKVLGKLQ